jgi:hypothetical protein
MRGSTILTVGILVASSVAAHAQAVSSGMMSHKTHESRVVPAPASGYATSHRPSAVASSRKPAEPETTGSIPKQQ